MQLVQEERLRWEIEWACNECGNTHDGDWGTPPEELRQIMLKDKGTHRILLADSAERRGRVLKAFREAFGMSIQEARAASLQMEGEGFQGTYVEVSFIEQLLNKAGVQTVRGGES
ncbi:hypothetical protein ACWD4V_18360 [Streptomyces tsukubensis]